MSDVFDDLSYDKDTGLFIWTGGVRKGNIAGSLDEYGYIRIQVKGKKHRAHRLAWLFCSGAFPIGEIDHINRVKTDNRICNLRDVSSSKNSENTKLRSDNKSGIKGVVWCKADKRWHVYLKSKYYGSYKQISDAKDRRKELEQFFNVEASY